MMREAFDARRRGDCRPRSNDIEGVHLPDCRSGAFYAFADVEGLCLATDRWVRRARRVTIRPPSFAAALLEEGHVAAVPGEAFGAPGYLRFSYAVADEET